MTRGPGDRTTEALFARYRARGDADALGEVFDRTAPSLLRIALHLCRDPHRAEDLLQATFVKAIERAAAWDDRRPLLPWLTGILGNEARMLREREGRTPDPSRVSAPTVEDPTAALESLELTAAVDEAIAALPATYRPVLRLHLAHGKHPAEIAHVLDRPPATVRSQLARGLQHLRKLLPVGIGAAASAQGGAGLPVVRAAVMARAETTGTATAIALPSAALSGGLLMKKFVAAGVLLILAGAWWLWPTPSPLPRSNSDAASPSGHVGQATSDVWAESRSKAAEETRRTPATPTAVETEPEATVTGRCVDEAGDPIGNVSVYLSAGIDTRAAPAPNDAGDPSERMFTSSDGRFSFRFAPHPRHEFQLHLIPAPPHVGGYIPILRVRAGEALDLEDLTLCRGVMVSGLVKSPGGQAAADVEIRAQACDDVPSIRSLPFGEFRSGTPRTPRSQSDGSFRFEKPLLPGRWRFLPNSDSHRADELVLAGSEQFIELVNHRPTLRISGTLLDRAGLAVPGVCVRAQADQRRGNQRASDDQGHFETTAAGGNPNEVFALIVDDENYELLLTEASYRWGQDDVELMLNPAPRLVLEVTRGRDGSSVESYAAHLHPRSPTLGLHTHRWAWEHPRGILDVPIHRGEYVATIEPSPDSGLASSPPIPITIGDLPIQRLAVALDEVRSQDIAVVNRQGEAVRGSAVELLLPSDPSIELRPHYSDPRSHGPSSAEPVATEDEAITDDSGRATVRGRSQADYSLRVTGADHAPMVLRGIRLGDDLQTVEVADGGTFSLTLLPLELHGDLREQAGLPRLGEVAPGRQVNLPGLQVRLVGGQPYVPLVPRRHTDALFDADGTATIRGLPPGRWSVHLTESTAPSSSQTVGMDVTFEITGDETVHRTVDWSARRPGRLTGTVMLNGRPFEGKVVIASRSVSSRSTTSNDEGRFQALVSPGTWQVGAYDPNLNRSIAIYGPTTVHLEPGGRAEAAFVVRSGRLDLRLVDHLGKPAPDVSVQFVRSDMPHAGWGSTDAEGRLQIVEAVGSIDLSFSKTVADRRVPDPPFRAGPFEITPEGNEVEVRLPEGWSRR